MIHTIGVKTKAVTAIETMKAATIRPRVIGNVISAAVTIATITTIATTTAAPIIFLGDTDPCFSIKATSSLNLVSIGVISS